MVKNALSAGAALEQLTALSQTSSAGLRGGEGKGNRCDRFLSYHQNLMFSVANVPRIFHRILYKSVEHNPANKQNKRTRKHNLLGGGDNCLRKQLSSWTRGLDEGDQLRRCTRETVPIKSSQEDD